jgi:UDP-3-O-[3-hydroxymyristoyl] glucosamine N-acyltransferase
MKISYITEAVGLEFNGVDFEINSINTLKDATSQELSFLENPKYIEDLKNTKAKAVFIHQNQASLVPSSSVAIITDEPYLKLALASKLFCRPPFEIGEPKNVADSAKIMNGVYIGKDAFIGENCVIMHGSYIGDNVTIGDNTLIYPNVSIYRDCIIGRDCIIHSGVVIGSDGFGFAHTKQGEHVKIYQNGNVVLENSVEVGANTAIDRAAFGSTLIKSGSKIDNLVQIAHNCDIGERVIICGQAGIAGSTKLGTNVVMGAQSGSAGHLSVGSFTQIAARGGVTKTLEGGKIYAGFPAVEHKLWLKQQATISRVAKKRS